jgi:hypothetical protein
LLNKYTKRFQEINKVIVLSGLWFPNINTN